MRDTDILTYAAIVDARDNERNVRWSAGEDILSGTVRGSAWTADGYPSKEGDFTATHIRVTLTTGMDVYLAVSDIKDYLDDGYLFFTSC